MEEYQSALEDSGKGMSAIQAETFVDNWRVLDQFTDPITGASATIFQKVVNGTPSGPKYLAIRGTEFQAGDLIADTILAAGVSSTLNPQYLALKAQLDDVWLKEGGLLAGERIKGARLELNLWKPSKNHGNRGGAMTANLIEMTIQIEKYSGGRIAQNRSVAVDPEKEGKFKRQAEHSAFRVAANQSIWKSAA